MASINFSGVKKYIPGLLILLPAIGAHIFYGREIEFQRSVRVSWRSGYDSELAAPDRNLMARAVRKQNISKSVITLAILLLLYAKLRQH